MAGEAIADLFDLTGKCAIVTGGAMGIGQGIAFRLSQAGADVMIIDIEPEAANETAEQIKARGNRAHFVLNDVSNALDAEKTVKNAVENLGGLDILVNNAGVYPFASTLKISEEMWDRVHNTNTKGLYFYSKAAANEMIRSGHGGKIVNIASVGALHPTGGLSHYDASKSAVVALTKAMLWSWVDIT